MKIIIIIINKLYLQDGFPKNDPTAKIHDQTNQTFANLQSTIANETELLATVVADIKDTIAKAKSKLTSIDSAKRDIEPIIVGIDGLSTTVDALYAAVSKRMIATLQNVGKFLNTTIASFVMVEWSNIGQIKLSSDTRTASKELRQIENNFYRALNTCLEAYNGSTVSDIFTLANIFNTFSMEFDTFLGERAGSDAIKRATLSRNILTSLGNYKSLAISTLNKIPTTTELNICITNQFNTARNDLIRLASTIVRPVPINGIITLQIEMLKANTSDLFNNFSTNVKTTIFAVANKIRNIRTFVTKNARDDPKTIFDSIFQSLTTGDDVTVQLIKTILPRITTVAKRLIVPLSTRESAIQREIIAAFARKNPRITECNTAIRAISTTKHAFNNAMSGCFNSIKDSTSAVLSATLGMINGTMISFTNQIKLAEQFKCGTNCTVGNLMGFVQQIRNKLEANKPMLTELRTSVTEQANRIYKAFENCMDDGVKQAVANLDEQSNADIKRCLALV